MASKTINVTVEAWQAAEAAKLPHESFSDLLLRSFRRPSVHDLVGLLRDEEADELMANVEEARTFAITESERRQRELGWP